MSSSTARPVIIGSGVSGMAISHALSKANVDHVFIGPPADNEPKLGESMDATSTLELMQFYPEFSQFYYNKDGFAFWLGDRTVQCSLKLAERNAFVRFFNVSRMPTPPTFLHLDRAGFDKALFDRVVKNPHCDYRDALVESVRYDEASDRVEEVRLSNGDVIPASHVFDATTAPGPVPSSAKLKYKELSTLQMVAFAHFRRSGAAGPNADENLEWIVHTNLVRMQRDTDGTDGFAWLIATGDTVSVGASIEAEDGGEIDGEEMMELIESAYCRRGVHVRAKFPDRTPAKTFRNKYFLV